VQKPEILVRDIIIKLLFIYSNNGYHIAEKNWEISPQFFIMSMLVQPLN